MAELNYTVDSQNADEKSFDPVPAGEYLAVIEDSKVESTKNGNGQILKLTYQIIDGPMSGRKVFENLNIQNPSVKAQEIAIRSLNAIGVAVGVAHISDSALLHNIPLYIDVKVQDSEQYGKQNRITKHRGTKGTQSEEQQSQTNGNPPSRFQHPGTAETSKTGFQPKKLK